MNRQHQTQVQTPMIHTGKRKRRNRRKRERNIEEMNTKYAKEDSPRIGKAKENMMQIDKAKENMTWMTKGKESLSQTEKVRAKRGSIPRTVMVNTVEKHSNNIHIQIRKRARNLINTNIKRKGETIKVLLAI